MIESLSTHNPASEPRKPSSGATLLLTATIRPGDVIYCERRDIRTRFDDYLFAFRFWLGETLIRRIVFVENSGFELGPFDDFAKIWRKKGKSVELLSYAQQPFDRNLGKSFGEARIIEFALQNSRLLTSDSFIIKGTGRYYPTNFFKVWPDITSAGFPFVLANFYRRPIEADSRYFGGHVEFFRHFLLPATREIDDSKGHYFEHALANAITAAIADGQTWRPFPKGGLLVDGVQASTNTAYPYPRWKRLIYRAVTSYRNRVPFRMGLGAPERRTRRPGGSG